jgi:hypothetical protein
MALQQDFLVKNGMVVRNTATISTIDSFLGTSTDLISAPVLDLNFTSGTLDPRISFSRPSGASYVGPDGYIKYAVANQPRFDYSPSNTGTIVGLLLEEQRTNLLPNSTKFAGWNNNPNLAITDNSVIAPDGTLSAAITIGQGGTRYQGSASAATSGTAYTYSIYFNPQDPTRSFRCYVDGNLGAGNTFSSAFVDVVPSTRAVTLYALASTGTVTVAGNGWYRMSVTFVPLSNSAMNCHVYPIDNTPTAWWGAQTEQGSFPTSFIPTSSAQVTRASDDARITGSAFNQFWLQNYKTQGTVYSEFVVETPGSTALVNLGSAGVWGLHCSTDGVYNGYGLRLNPPSPFGDQIQFIGRAYNATSASLVSGLDPTPPGYIIANKIYKDVCAWDQYTMYQTVCDSINTATNGTINGLNNLNTLQIGAQSQGGAGYLILCGWIRRLKIFSTRLPNTQMLALTSSTQFTGQNFNNLAPRTTYTANTSNFTVQQGVVIRANLEVPDVDKLYVDNLQRPSQQPSLNLNFLTGILDPRITFTRSSGASYVGPDSYIKYARANQPRFNYSSTSTGTCLGLLIESQRTNLFPYSLAIGGTNWQVRAGTTSILNAGLAPDGTNCATLVTPTSGDGYVWQSITLSPSTAYTFSVYAISVSGSPTIRFNAYTGVGGQAFTSGASNLTSNYTRYSFSFASTATVGAGDVGFYIQTGSALTWGAQLEAGTFATSIIPTTNATVTRAAETAVISGQNFSRWYNPAQGTIYAEGYTSPDFANFSPVTTITDASYSNNYIGQYQYIGLQGATVRWETSIQLGDPLVSTPTSTGTLFKLATVINPGNYFSATAGAVSPSVTDRRAVTSVDRIYIGNSNGGYINSTLRKVIYYPTALSTATLRVLTSSTYI